MKKTIRDYQLFNKKVLIRVDFNVPIKDGIILDDNRMIESLPTIKYAIQKKAKVILFSHLGRIRSEEDKVKNDLRPLCEKLSLLLEQPVIFIEQTRGDCLEKAVQTLKCGEVLLIQNTRYEDFPDKKESNNDEALGKYWASLGDIYINDAFGTSHRSHASNVGIASHLPSGIGFLIEKELGTFRNILDSPERPFTVILGGSKVADKIGVIQKLIHSLDYLLIGGAMAYTFLKAECLPIGSSIVEEQWVPFCSNLLKKYPDKIILPIDTIVAKEIKKDAEHRNCFISDIQKEEIGLDIGRSTIKLFKQYLDESRTIVWNGPLGMFELEPFSYGTKSLCEMISSLDAKTVVGGGDTASAIINMGYKEKMTHISTGGGASLELLEGKNLPGIEIIEEK